jgi:hypothetical protein
MIIDDLNHLEIATQDNQVEGGYYYSSQSYSAGAYSGASGLLPQSVSGAIVIPGGGAAAGSAATALIGSAYSGASAGYSQYSYSGYYW